MRQLRDERRDVSRPVPSANRRIQVDAVVLLQVSPQLVLRLGYYRRECYLFFAVDA